MFTIHHKTISWFGSDPERSAAVSERNGCSVGLRVGVVPSMVAKVVYVAKLVQFIENNKTVAWPLKQV